MSEAKLDIEVSPTRRRLAQVKKRAMTLLSKANEFGIGDEWTHMINTGSTKEVDAALDSLWDEADGAYMHGWLNTLQEVVNYLSGESDYFNKRQQDVAEGELNTSYMNKLKQDFYNKNPHFKRLDREKIFVGNQLASKVTPNNKPGQVVKKPMTPFKTQGMTEEVVENNPVVQAIARRLLNQRSDLLQKYGPEKVAAAIDDVADFVGSVDEIGSSDISVWVKQVEQSLSAMGGSISEAAKWRQGYSASGHPAGYKHKSGDVGPLGGTFTNEPSGYDGDTKKVPVQKHRDKSDELADRANTKLSTSGKPLLPKNAQRNLKSAIKQSLGKHGPVGILPEQTVTEGESAGVRPFLITAKLADGNEHQFQVHAQNEQQAREKLAKNYNQITILSVKDDFEGLDPKDDAAKLLSLLGIRPPAEPDPKLWSNLKHGPLINHILASVKNHPQQWAEAMEECLGKYGWSDRFENADNNRIIPWLNHYEDKAKIYKVLRRKISFDNLPPMAVRAVDAALKELVSEYSSSVDRILKMPSEKVWREAINTGMPVSVMLLPAVVAFEKINELGQTANNKKQGVTEGMFSNWSRKDIRNKDGNKTEPMKKAAKKKVKEGETKHTSTGRIHKGTYGTSFDDDYKAPPTQRGRGRPRLGADSTTGEVMKPDWSAFSKKVSPKTKLPTTRHKMVGETTLSEKAKSQQQQKFFGMAHALQKGEKIKGASPELKKVASTMGKQDVKDFAATKHKGLPKKVSEGRIKELAMDLDNLTDAAFLKKYKMTKAQAKKNMTGTVTTAEKKVDETYAKINSMINEEFGVDDAADDAESQLTYEQEQLKEALGEELYTELTEIMKTGDIPSEELYSALAQHFRDTGEIPEDSDEDESEWLSNRVYEIFSDSVTEGAYTQHYMDANKPSKDRQSAEAGSQKYSEIEPVSFKDDPIQATTDRALKYGAKGLEKVQGMVKRGLDEAVCPTCNQTNCTCQNSELSEMLRLSGLTLESGEVDEGNEFTLARKEAIKAGKDTFTVAGKTYKVTGDTSDEEKIEECTDGSMSPVPESGQTTGDISVNSSISSRGDKSVSVTATGDQADILNQLLSLAGLSGGAETSYSETPAVDVVDIMGSEQEMSEEKDSRYQANTTPEEHLFPIQAITKGGDGEVAGKEKKMNSRGYKFVDNPLAMKESNMSARLMREYESIKLHTTK